MTASYGPCVGMTRLQRWERAKKWGLNPPEEVGFWFISSLFRIQYAFYSWKTFRLICLDGKAD